MLASPVAASRIPSGISATASGGSFSTVAADKAVSLVTRALLCAEGVVRCTAEVSSTGLPSNSGVAETTGAARNELAAAWAGRCDAVRGPDSGSDDLSATSCAEKNRCGAAGPVPVSRTGYNRMACNAADAATDIARLRELAAIMHVDAGQGRQLKSVVRPHYCNSSRQETR